MSPVVVIFGFGDTVPSPQAQDSDTGYPGSAVHQVWDYTLDFKNSDETSHACLISPVLVATERSGGRVFKFQHPTPIR